MVRPFVASLTLLLCICYLVLRSLDRATWVAYAQASSPAPGVVHFRRPGYVGDEACMPCHNEQAVPYSQTAHHLTSQLPGSASILGSFKDEESVLMIENPPATDLDPRLYFKMEIHDGHYYETAVAEKGSKKLTRSGRIDIVTGSGVRGQTYLYWAGNELFELPVSYWSDGNQWINSPGYTDGTANFDRHVDPRCLECHATYLKPLSSDPQTNVFDKDSLETGISCETCHGAGADHIEREEDGSARPTSASSNGILNPARFIRDRQMDLCALCHSGGQRAELKPAFTYRPGRKLEEYFAADPVDTTDRPDVHGNQVGLLKKSRCYLSSPAMSCSTCHDVHHRERSAAEYSERCLSCHRWQSCGVSRTMGIKIVRNCIDCHMPLQQTSAIVSKTANRILHASIRSHWIKAYPGHEQE
jgi:Cytochrome c554 and c-prime